MPSSRRTSRIRTNKKDVEEEDEKQDVRGMKEEGEEGKEKR